LTERYNSGKINIKDIKWAILRLELKLWTYFIYTKILRFVLGIIATSM
jgi:hypothetical protein